MRVHVHYNKFIEQAIVRDEYGNHVFAFPACINFKLRFPKFNINAVNVYDLPKAIKIKEFKKKED